MSDSILFGDVVSMSLQFNEAASAGASKLPIATTGSRPDDVMSPPSQTCTPSAQVAVKHLAPSASSFCSNSTMARLSNKPYEIESDGLLVNQPLPNLLQARLASMRKLQRILSIEAPALDAADALAPSAPSSPDCLNRPFSSAFEYDELPQVEIGSSPRPTKEPPQLVLKRETVDFARMLLQFGEPESHFNGDSGIDGLAQLRDSGINRGSPPLGGLQTALSAAALLNPAFSDDPLMPTACNNAGPSTTDPFFSPTALAPVATDFASSSALALAFPRPPAFSPARQRSALVSPRFSSSRQIGRSQSYKRLASHSPASRGPLVPLLPTVSALMPSTLAVRPSACKTIKKQKSASALKESVRWATRSSSVVVVVRPTAEEQVMRESRETVGFLTPTSDPRPVYVRAQESYGSIIGSDGHASTAT